MLYFGHTMKDGIKGVVLKPVRGAKKNGAAGFVTGVGKGMVGLVAAPVSGGKNSDDPPPQTPCFL